MDIFLSPRLGLFLMLCVDSVIRSKQAKQTVYCQTHSFAQGEIISTKPYGNLRFCGSSVGWYFALKPNVLFHLQCTASQPQATAVIVDLNNRLMRSGTFNNGMMCDVQSPQGPLRTGDNAHRIATRLTGSLVPYDHTSCNAHHYVEYLAYGQVYFSTPKNTCPVFQRFNASSNVVDPGFQLRGKNRCYDWPGANRALVLCGSSSQSSSRSSWSPMSAISNRSLSQNSAQNSVDRRGSSSGGGKGYRSRPRGVFVSSASKSKPFWRGLG